MSLYPYISLNHTTYYEGYSIYQGGRLADAKRGLGELTPAIQCPVTD